MKRHRDILLSMHFTDRQPRLPRYKPHWSDLRSVCVLNKMKEFQVKSLYWPLAVEGLIGATVKEENEQSGSMECLFLFALLWTEANSMKCFALVTQLHRAHVAS
ncbi:hypothetical protein Baya_15090 [Bagarius yarrelli]|uniref:Uncharacterized protein n=1 Tax=Bagarius yarrelli TaxID=175774 RepID=A0A556VB22_BAGYA|nr:hypothetical protein Baya_15090 [Bagarius yarrelli]